MAQRAQNGGKIRVLVGIASYGQKNLPFLRQIIQAYQDMSMDVDVVVCSEAPKELGPEVKVVVGLPSSNPWSLPFAHKAVFAENLERYDIFIYTEDDMEVGEDKIRHFLRAATVMEPDEIPGFLRFEVTPDGTKLLTDVHGAFHWKAESVRRRGDYTVAEFSNEHAGFYILTRAQLKRAIASGGFLKAPYEGRYGLPETAATDPYTGCGFRKVICISSLENFLIRHMPNLYVNRHGVTLSAFKEQVKTLLDIARGSHPASRLMAVEPKVLQRNYSKSYYEQPNADVLSLVPNQAKTVLSIGCGCGATEAELKLRGCEVTAVPLDSVIGAAAGRRGFEVVYGSLDACLQALKGRTFDAVLITNLLHLQPEPEGVLEQCARFVGAGGTLVVGGPNFRRLPIVVRRTLGKGDYRKLGSFDESGISLCGPGTLAKHLRNAGLTLSVVHWLNHEFGTGLLARMPLRLGKITGQSWVLRARR